MSYWHPAAWSWISGGIPIFSPAPDIFPARRECSKYRSAGVRDANWEEVESRTSQLSPKFLQQEFPPWMLNDAKCPPPIPSLLPVLSPWWVYSKLGASPSAPTSLPPPVSDRWQCGSRLNNWTVNRRITESLTVGVPPGTNARHKAPKPARESNIRLIHIYNLINPQAAGRCCLHGAAGEQGKNK